MSGQWAVELTYDSHADYMRWTAAVRGIKDHIAAISNDGNDDAARVPLYHEWLNRVQEFITEWGEAFLPPDIKQAVNGVEAGLGIEQTVWADPPENHLLVDYMAALRQQRYGAPPPAGE